VTFASPDDPDDTASLRKERGAFFTPDAITRFMTNWAIRQADDEVLEPAAGDAAFLVAAVDRLRELAAYPSSVPTVQGVEIHAPSAGVARKRVLAAGGEANIHEGDFFIVEPKPAFDAVIGNPPYIRYQDFKGEARARAREAALRAGISLTGLASSWAAFTVHGALFLKQGGRLALVLPAELLAVNYAAPVRRFLFNRFRDIQLVLFDEQVFPEAEADVVLLLADGYLDGPADHMTIRQTKNAATLPSLGPGLSWSPSDPSGKWTSSLIDPNIMGAMQRLVAQEQYSVLESWGDTTLGMVTGNNRYFTLSPQRVKELGLRPKELLDLSPPGSSHLRVLSLTKAMLTSLGREGNAIHLFYPTNPPSAAAAAYIEDGRRTAVDSAYKCRVRKLWYQVPLVPPADLLLTCMNADTPRIVANEAGVRHLNSVHGVYLKKAHREIGRELLPLASLNSVTLLHAEMVGRAYGGGILKIEPKEADVWLMPSPTLVAQRAEALRRVKKRAVALLRKGRLLEAVKVVDGALMDECGELSKEKVRHLRSAHLMLSNRRNSRAASGK
jgi:adenine-specific DNA-methyltransferase